MLFSKGNKFRLTLLISVVNSLISAATLFRNNSEVHSTKKSPFDGRTDDKVSVKVERTKAVFEHLQVTHLSHHPYLTYIFFSFLYVLHSMIDTRINLNRHLSPKKNNRFNKILLLHHTPFDAALLSSNINTIIPRSCSVFGCLVWLSHISWHDMTLLTGLFVCFATF